MKGLPLSSTNTPPEEALVSAPQEFRNFSFDPSEKTFVIDGSAVLPQQLDRHTSLDGIPVVCNRQSPVQMHRLGRVFVAPCMPDWARENRDLFNEVPQVMREVYTGFFAKSKYNHRSYLGHGFHADQFWAGGLQFSVPGQNGRAYLKPVQGAEYGFKKAASAPERASLLAGIGLVAHFMQQQRNS